MNARKPARYRGVEPFRRLAMLVVFGCSACIDRSSPPEPAPTDPPVAQPPSTPNAEDEGTAASEAKPSTQPKLAGEPSSRPDEPIVARREGRTVITSSSVVEELVLIPDGVAFVQGSEIWALGQDDAAPRRLATAVDPHALTCDGTWLYWLGHERNGKLDLATRRIETLPSMGTPGQEEDLAAGDVLYGRSATSIWRFEGLGVTRIAFRIDEAWSPMAGLGAGTRIVILPIAERATKGAPSFFLLRLGLDGKMTRIPVDGIPRPLRWSVSRVGSVVMLGGGDEVLRQDAKASKARVLFEEPGVAAVCWCGDDVCTVDTDDDVLRRHRGGGAEAERVADGVGSIRHLACGADRIAWSTSEERGSEIHVVQAR